jgi:hypothetical protein
VATWDSLTPEQQATAQSWQTLQAGWCSAQAKASDLGENVDTTYNSQVAPLGLDSTEIIPKSNNVDGAESMSYGDCVTIESHIQGVLNNYNTVPIRDLWAKACGAENL